MLPIPKCGSRMCPKDIHVFIFGPGDITWRYKYVELCRNVNILPYMTKELCRCNQTYHLEFRRLSWVCYIVPIYSHKSLKRKRLSHLGQRDETEVGEIWRIRLLLRLWRWRKGAWRQGLWQLPEAGKGPPLQEARRQGFQSYYHKELNSVITQMSKEWILPLNLWEECSLRTACFFHLVRRIPDCWMTELKGAQLVSRS